jgi:hypothetical protein
MPPVGSCSAAGKAAIGPLEFPTSRCRNALAVSCFVECIPSATSINDAAPSRRLGVQAKAHLSQFLLLETN